MIVPGSSAEVLDVSIISTRRHDLQECLGLQKFLRVKLGKGHHRFSLSHSLGVFNWADPIFGGKKHDFGGGVLRNHEIPG